MDVAEYKEPFGRDYRAMVSEVRACLDALKDRFPGYQDHGYHYYGSPWTFAQIGTAFGEAMVKLLRK